MLNTTTWNRRKSINFLNIQCNGNVINFKEFSSDDDYIDNNDDWYDNFCNTLRSIYLAFSKYDGNKWEIEIVLFLNAYTYLTWLIMYTSIVYNMCGAYIRTAFRSHD